MIKVRFSLSSLMLTSESVSLTSISTRKFQPGIPDAKHRDLSVKNNIPGGIDTPRTVINAVLEFKYLINPKRIVDDTESALTESDHLAALEPCVFTRLELNHFLLAHGNGCAPDGFSRLYHSLRY